ncbi:MAG: hypothetical protein OEM82_00640 [Acidobacteriota bacterium]|nr:hypothetical protein [Acidobacteriota bacterium]MDH3528435.1 hypothetical protein [Acidobacteriota bacterium]
MTLALILISLFWPVNTPADSWECSNNIEITCGAEGCVAADPGAFTPMRVSFDSLGGMRVCAYSGCWEGAGKIFENADFLVLTGSRLNFSAKEPASSNQDVMIALDKKDNVAMLKAGGFSHPIVCKRN